MQQQYDLILTFLYLQKSSKKTWGFGKSKPVDSFTIPAPEGSTIPPGAPQPPSPPPPALPAAEIKLADSEQQQNKDVYSAALATAEAAVAAAKAAADVVRLTASTPRFSNKSKEEVAAIKIQTAFRAYLVDLSSLELSPYRLFQ